MNLLKEIHLKILRVLTNDSNKTDPNMLDDSSTNNFNEVTTRVKLY